MRATSHRGAAVGGGLGDGREHLHVVYALVERGVAGQRVRLVDAGDLLQEGARLEDEAVVLAKADARCVHRQPAGEVRVVRPDDHPPVTARAGGALVQHELELRGTLLLPLRGAFVAEDLERETVRVAGGDAGDLHDADAVLETGR